MEDAELLAIKGRAWKRFSKLPGVHAVGIGRRVARGVRTDETVLTVFVARKLPLESLDAQFVVAPVFEGVRTDIVESPIPRTLDGPITITPREVPNGRGFEFTTTVDPPPIGVRIVAMLKLHHAGNRVVSAHWDANGQMIMSWLPWW